MLSLMYPKKSFSTMAIGGDHGMDAGIDLCIMIVVGVSIKGSHFGTREYLVAGEKITEAISGEVIHGIIILYIMLISKETGEPGMIPTIGVNQSTVSLRITMMGDRMVVGKADPQQALKERWKKVELQLAKGKLPQALKERWKRVELQLAKGKLPQALKERSKRVELQLAKGKLEQVGKALQEPKYKLRIDIPQVKPLKVNIPKERKDRNEVQVERQEINCPTDAHSKRLIANAGAGHYASNWYFISLVNLLGTQGVAGNHTSVLLV